jgi:integrase
LVFALAEAVLTRYKALVICAAGTGLRQGETFGLTLEHVHLLQRELRVEQQLVQIVGEPSFQPPKTESSRRRIPIPGVVVDALAAHIAEFGVGDHNLIFTDDEGHALRRNRFSAKVWRPAVAAADCPPGTVLHDLRHCYASLLIAGGQSVKAVQSRLGHASAVETLDTYSHIWPDSEDKTRSAIEAAFKETGFGLTEDFLRTESPA